MTAIALGGVRGGFIERTLDSLLKVTERSLYAERIARERGLLQTIDPRVKVIGLFLLLIASGLSHSLKVVAALFGLGLLLAFASRVPIRALATRAWLGAFVFTGVLAAPAVFMTPGRIVQLPLGMHMTVQGLRAAAFLISRVETAVTFSLLLILCTLWTRVLHALRVLRVPVVFIVILGMTYRYIFVLLRSAHDIFESRRSRHVGAMPAAESRRLAAASIGVLLSKTLQMSGDVYLAMQARGFRGEVYLLDDPSMAPTDWLALGCFVVIAFVAVWAGR